MTEEELAVIEADVAVSRVIAADTGATTRIAVESVAEQMLSLVAEVRRLQGLVKAAEWASTPGGRTNDAVCPWCEQWFDAGHAPDCAAFVPQRST